VFQHGQLIDANAAGRAILSQAPDDRTDWPSVAPVLRGLFADVPEILGIDPEPVTTHAARSPNDRRPLRIEQRGKDTRLSIFEPAARAQPNTRMLGWDKASPNAP